MRRAGLHAALFTASLWLTLASTSAFAAATTLHNASELRDWLLQGRSPLTLTEAPRQRGCNAAGCQVQVDGLRLRVEQGALLTAGGAAVRKIRSGLMTVQLGSQVDWDPLAAYTLAGDGHDWGTCLEFSHKGLARSGRWQRWTTLLLVPRPRPGAKPLAYQFTGYWAACDSLLVGSRPRVIEMPLLDRAGPALPGLRLTRRQCDARRCLQAPDGKYGSGIGSGSGSDINVDEETGALTVLQTRR